MDKIKNSDHLLNTLLPYSFKREYNYDMRNGDNQNFHLFNDKQYCRTKLFADFFTFKYH